MNILITTHGNLGKEFLKTAEMIMGKTDHISILGLQVEDNIDFFKEKIETVIQQKEIKIILTDMENATPFNAATIASRSIRNPPKIIAGINLPLLIELINLTQNNEFKYEQLEVFIQKCKESITLYKGMTKNESI